jgi:alcohol-forming fatty acyl-CoA reductase
MSDTINEFYNGKNILITGATGFVGKLLIEKLLYSCDKLNNIYCLIREKNGHTGDERLNEITSSKVFDKLRKKEPYFRERLTPITGNILESDLNLGEKEAKLLKEKIHIVFHLAGTVNLDQDLKTSLLTNVYGLRNTLNFAKKINNLEAFVHVSSIYANSNRPFIEERIYPSNIEPQKILNLLEWMEDEWIQLATKKLIGDKPNTFTYTKWLSETLLEQEGGDLPIVIIRPSTIGAAWKEPFVGWVEKSSGPCDLFIAAGRGYLRSIKGEGHAVLDIVPVDIVVNLLISSAWHTVSNKKNEIQIYHCSTGGLHPFRWGEMENFVTMYSKNIPFERAFRRPNLTLTSNSLVHDYWVFISHLIPAYMSDAGLALIGKKPRVVNVYKKIHKMLSSLECLTQLEWKCSYENVIALRNSTIESDSQVYYVDPRGIHWPTYIENYLIGTKKYLLNEDLHGVPAAKQHLKNLRNIRWCANIIISVLLWRLLIAKSQPARNLWFFVLNLAARFVRFFRISSTMIKQ